ncbi:ribonuclease HI [Flavobacteriaceae bacterium]|nr:ribonuclease HI [Flavobacteriaceae bacterium]MDB4112835.1 ribonuclease HI [Flavobacteriaceae bacterium]MDB4186148.1 ribonuclease HI [Flavobacteriaceae bacterium]MDB9823587.1 ribonuclease HI [Flavobacteriaceae bacterium]MDB9941347.1 ribonuclease HI [Flavobacteriaceae bacterium]
MATIHIYTDGSALGNPGPGGYGIIIEWVGKHYIKEFSRGFKYTTNNRMELLAVIEALEMLKQRPMDVLVFSDSKYVIEAVDKKWVFGWVKKQFKGKKNPDLWKRFLAIYAQHNVRFQWVKGHNDHPQNERCDYLAVTAAKNMAVEHDRYYEQSVQKK